MNKSGDDVPAIELRHVTKAFGARRVLDDVSLVVPTRQSLGILGRSGTGKSVALKHIVGLIKPDVGQVLVQGEDITTMSSRELARVRRRIGFLFQNAALFDSISVGENVAFPLRRHTELDEDAVRIRVRQLLGEVGLEREFDTMPAELSGGMRKRAGLARAMALDPPILLADEPGAGLDPVTAAEIDALLARLKQQAGATIVVVTHNIPSARAISDELIFLHEGRVLIRGSPEVLERSELALVREFMRSEGVG
jgi:phospholipid/cholesterol/gamma-HCH transport system ATP-binding protein